MTPRITRAAALLVVAFCAAAGTAQGQFGGGRGAQRATYPEGGGAFGPLPAPPLVSVIALEHAKDLALSDSQRTALETVRTSQDSANAPLRARLDSLRPTRLSAGGPNDMSQEQRDEMEARQRATQLVLAGFKSSNDEARAKVLAVLTPDQRNRMKEYEEDAQKKFDEDSRKRSRPAFGGGEGRGAGGGRGRPPEV